MSILCRVAIAVSHVLAVSALAPPLLIAQPSCGCDTDFFPPTLWLGPPVECLDGANPQWLKSDGTFSTIPSLYAVGGRHVTAAATDGVTSVVLRLFPRNATRSIVKDALYPLFYKDDCDPAPAVYFSDYYGSGSCASSGLRITRTYRGTDYCGNQATLIDDVQYTSESPGCGNGTATFRIEDPTDNSTTHIGTIRTLTGSRSTSITVPLLPILNARHAVLLYEAPVDFVRSDHPSDGSASSRSVRIHYEYTPPGAASPFVSGYQDLLLKRPPALLVHGIWGSISSTWGAAWAPGLGDGTRRRVVFASYAPTNHRAFATNASVVEEWTQSALEAERLTGTAVTQADVVGHSMGGLLSRIYASSPTFRNKKNYFAGSIRRLLTINTPHGGTPLADLLLELYDSWATLTLLCGPGYSGPGTLCSAYASFKAVVELATGRPPEGGVTGGGVGDLRSGSSPIQALKGLSIPCYAIASDRTGAGVTKETALWQVLPWLKKKLLGGAELTEASIFCGGPSDLIVPLASQLGAAYPAERVVQGLTHTHATKVANLVDDVDGLLDLPMTSPLYQWATFPDYSPELSCLPSFGPASPQSRAPERNSIATEVPLSITSVSPGLGSSVTAGEETMVTVEVAGGTPPIAVTVLGQNLSATANSAPYSFTWSVPLLTTSSTEFIVLARDVEDSARVEHVIVPLSNPAVLDSTRLFPRVITLRPGDRRQLGVTGFYSNGVISDLTSASNGAQYVSTNMAVVSADADGRVTGVGVGTGRVAVANGARNDTVDVVVLPGEDAIPPTVVLSGDCAPILRVGDTANVTVSVADDRSVFYQSVKNGIHALDTSAPGQRVFEVVARDAAGNETRATCSYLVLEAATDVASTKEDPSRLVLAPLEPNPLRTLANVRFFLPRAGRATLTLLDLAGRVVVHLVDDSFERGWQEVRLNKSELSADALPRGLYFVRLVCTPGDAAVQRVVLLR